MNAPIITSIIIPTYNERENISNLIHAIFAVLKQDNACGNIVDFNIIVVDDNSPDGTANEVKKLMEQYPLHLIKREGKQGIGSAYIAGFKEALSLGSDVIFEMDADFSHDPAYLPEFIKNIKESDVVIGSRYIPGGDIKDWSWWRKIVSKTANMLARTLTGLDVNDITTGYRAYRKEVLQKINLDSIKSNGYEFQAEMLYRIKEKGFKIKEIPIIFVDRRCGKSKLSKKEVINFFSLCIRIWVLRIT